MNEEQELEITAGNFFGFFPEKVCSEIYAIGYNEYLKAVSTLKDTLLQDFPEKHEEIELSCSKMLDRYSQEFDKDWFPQFFAYFRKNIFTVGDTVPVYKMEMNEREANKQAHDMSLNLRHCIMATEYLNVQLVGKIRELDLEIERRKELLTKVASMEQKLELVRRARELEQRLEAVDLPDHPLEM